MHQRQTIFERHADLCNSATRERGEASKEVCNHYSFVKKPGLHSMKDFVSEARMRRVGITRDILAHKNRLPQISLD